MGQESWDRIMAALEPVALASESFADDAAALVMDDLFDAIETWARHIGFDVREQPDGNLYVDVVRQDWNWD